MRVPKLLFEPDIYPEINRLFTSQKYSQYVLLVDENTREHCLPYFVENLDEQMPEMSLLEIPAGEEHKNIQTCVNLWESLSEDYINRKAVIINLGGGVLTDLGGFVASTYKRGIDWINIPTTLLSMVDASVGGKTGIDLGFSKNQIGTFQNPIFTAIDPSFLGTLPKKELISGVAEMLKHGLIAEKEHWHKLSSLTELTIQNLTPLITDSILIKKNIVEQDPTEKGLRKALNLGHTIGHAIETYFLSNEELTTLLHGEAIAMGIVAECYLSPNLSNQDKRQIKAIFQKIFPKQRIPKTSYQSIFQWTKQDKKNTQQTINFTGIERIGKYQLDLTLDFQNFKQALDFYQE